MGHLSPWIFYRLVKMITPPIFCNYEVTHCKALLTVGRKKLDSYPSFLPSFLPIDPANSPNSTSKTSMKELKGNCKLAKAKTQRAKAARKHKRRSMRNQLPRKLRENGCKSFRFRRSMFVNMFCLQVLRGAVLSAWFRFLLILALSFSF